jgi:hypothetical protein
MAGLREVLGNLNDWIKEIVNVGLGIALIFLVVDILFGTTTGIVGNLSELIKSFTTQGIVGLIALIIFVAIYSK